MASVYDNIVTSITSLLSGVKYSDGSALYQQVFDGEPKTFENMSPVATVSMIPPFSSHRHTAGGGKIKESSHFQVVTYLDLTDEARAEALLRYVIVNVLPVFQQHVALNGVTGVVSSKIGQSFPAYLQVQKLLYRAFVFQVEVEVEYFVSVQN